MFISHDVILIDFRGSPDALEFIKELFMYVCYAVIVY
jgi:hypothetical protein